MTPAEKEEIEVLDPPQRTLYVAGEKITVTPLSIGQVGPVRRVLDPLLAELRGDKPEGPDGEPEGPDTSAEDTVIEFDLKDFVMRHTDEAVEIVAIAISRRPLSRQWVAGLYIDDFIDLATAVFEVNLDFFNRRLVASLARLTARLQAAAGSISSASSSPPATTGGM